MGSGVGAFESGEVWERVLRPLGAEIVARAGELSAELQDRQRPQAPELFPDPEAGEANRASAQATLKAIGGMLERGEDPRPVELPPETVAYAREGARQGLPLASMLRLYRLGHAALWEFLVAEMAARAADREELAQATSMCAAALFAYVDGALILADEVCATERERLARSAAAMRAQTIAAILDGRMSDAHDAGRRLRYEIAREHVGICAWLERAPEDGDSLALLDAAILEIARALGQPGALLHPLGLLAAAGWVSSIAGIGLARVATGGLDPASFPGVRVALGEPAGGLAGFRSTHFDALNARRVASLAARPAGSVTRFGHVALQALASVELDQARTFVQRQLGPLAATDDTTLRLAATLRGYLDEHASRSRAAKRLGIHENTVSYRIRQVEEILGRSVERDTLDLRVALALAPLVRR